MTALAWYLLLTLLLAGGTFFFARPGGWASSSVGSKRFVSYCAWATVILSGSFILYFLGWERSGAPPGSETAPYRLEHTGFYTGLGDTLSFRSDDTSRSARLEALGAGESLRLTPRNTRRALAWNFATNARILPLRVGDTCVNLPADNWFQPGDSLVVDDPDQKLFVSVQWQSDPGSSSNRWLYNQGTLVGERRTYDFATPVLIEDRALREGLRLSAMIQHKIPRLLRSFEAASAKKASWWQHLLHRESEPQERLAQGVELEEVKARYRLLFPLTRSVLWVRKTLGEPASPMGVFLDPEPLATAPRFVRDGGGRRHELRAPAGPGPNLELEIPGGGRIRYGFGEGDAATLVLDGAVSRDRTLGLIAHVRLGNPPSWQLPERPAEGFMIFSQEVLLPNVVGFQLDSGLDREPFYAKASYLTGKGTFEIKDGKDFLGTVRGVHGHPAQPPDEIFRLGSTQRGVALRFVRQASPVPFPGPLAVLFLLIGAWAFGAEMRSDRTSGRPRLDLAWALFWGLTVSLLVVRLILSYRVAILPPTDATPLEVSNVFHKSFLIAFAALAFVPLLLVAVRWLAGGARSVARLNGQVSAFGNQLSGARPVRNTTNLLVTLARRTPVRLRAWLSALPPLLLVVGGVLGLWIMLGATTRKEDFLGVRINIAAHLLILLGLVASARWIVRQGRRERVLFGLSWMLLPALLVMLLTGDLGFGIHLLSLGLAALLLAVWNRPRLRRSAVAALVGGTLLLVAAPALIPYLLRIPWIDHWVMKLSDPGERHFYYRLVVPEVDKEVLVRPAEEDEYSMTYFMRNSQQHWQMLLYASEGVHLPRGYGHAPLSRVGMTYPTSMSDCVYAVYVLSEHGGWAGFLLLLVYAALGAVTVFASAYLPDLDRHRSLALISVGAAFALAAFYMACANLGLLVFTGQNLPLLSLVSRSDLTAGVVLLGVATVLLRYRLAGEQTVPFRAQPWVRRIALSYLALLGLAAVILAIQLFRIAGDETLREDFTLSDKVYAEFNANLPNPEKSTPLRLDGEELRVDAPDLLSWPEKQFVRAFELQSDRYDPLASFYYLEDVDGEPRLRINQTYLNLASPFKPPTPWNGILEARGEELPALSLLGEGLTLRPRTATAGRTVDLEQDDPLEEPEKLSNRIVLAWRTTNLCEISNRSGQLFIASYGPSDEVRFQVYVDGELLRPSSERRLMGREVLRITGGPGRGSHERGFSYSLMYLGRQRPVLAFSSWRNGRLRRVVSDGSLARLAEDLGQALDSRGNEPGPPLPSHITLTIDDSLHQQLERNLEDWMPRIYHAGDPLRRRRGISLTVLDAFSGEVLAMPSLPNWKIRRELSRPGPGLPPERQWLRNDNLRNHVIGSTIKPILFAAIASGYWPAHVDLSRLSIQHTSDCSAPSQGATHLHCSMAGVHLDEPWDCLQSESPLGLIDARSFLVDSRNFYAGVLGLLGTAVSPEDWNTIVRPQAAMGGATTVSYDGIVQAANLAWAPPDRSPFTFDDSDDRKPPRPKVTELGHSILFHQMSTVFGLEPNLDSGDNDRYMEYLLRTTESFYPALAKTEVHRSRGIIAEALPDLQSLRPGSFHSIRKYLLPLFLGGGSAGRWNNVRLAEAAARIATGVGVRAHLEGPGPSQGFSPLGAPLSIGDWRNAHLIEPLRSVGLTGTAEGLRPFILNAEQDGYRILLKTGTLEELPPPEGSLLPRFENELLLFVIGKWQNGGFVPGLTLSGVLHLQDSKPLDRREWIRTEVAQPILSDLLVYLKEREARRMNDNSEN